MAVYAMLDASSSRRLQSNTQFLRASVISRQTLAAMWLLGTLSVTPVSAQELWTASSGTTTVALNRSYLARLGIDVVAEDPSVAPWEPDGLSLQEPGTMGFEVETGQLEFHRRPGTFHRTPEWRASAPGRLRPARER